MELYIQSIYCISAQDFTLNYTVENHLFKQYSGKTLKLVEPDYNDYISLGDQRRMSKPVKMSIFAAYKCIEKSEKIDAIIVANGLGVIKPSEIFLEKLLLNDERGPSPTAFMQSLHSSIAGQLSLDLKFQGYTMTYTQSAFSFENALMDAQMLISEGETETILLGTVGELTNGLPHFQPSKKLEIKLRFQHQVAIGSIDKNSLCRLERPRNDSCSGMRFPPTTDPGGSPGQSAAQHGRREWIHQLWIPDRVIDNTFSA